MILSDRTIKDMLNNRDSGFVIKPLEDIQIQPGSVDIRLSNDFCRIDKSKLPIESNGEQVMSVEKSAPLIYEYAEGIILPPHSFILGSTIEYIELPSNLTAFVEGRSSYGRLGLFIQNAGWVDPGFKGTITLELFNASDVSIKLIAGKRIGQLVFAKLDTSADTPYKGKYQGQKGVTGSRVHMDSET